MQTMAPSSGEVQPALARKLSVFLIEAQALFVPALAEVFDELGLLLGEVASDVDLHRMLDEQPDVVFVDTDYLDREPLRLINAMRMLLPGAVLCVYTGQRSPDWAKASHFAGATAVFSKNAQRFEIVDGMKSALREEHYTDARLRD